jgi:predicted metal-binding membrane protein
MVTCHLTNILREKRQRNKRVGLYTMLSQKLIGAEMAQIVPSVLASACALWGAFWAGAFYLGEAGAFRFRFFKREALSSVRVPIVLINNNIDGRTGKIGRNVSLVLWMIQSTSQG